MTKFWRLQNLAEIQLEPSWDSYDMAEPSEPADSDGWDGYWWAYKYAPSISGKMRPDYSSPFLIRAEDVERAREEEMVDIFVPGIFGCKDASSMVAYIEQVGGVGDDQFICLYEGDEYPEYEADDGSVFGPRRLLTVYPAKDWLERAERGEFEFDEEKEG
jgi:hypothetical protein